LSYNSSNAFRYPTYREPVNGAKKKSQKRLILLIGVLLVIGFTTTSLTNYFTAAGAFRTEMTEDILPLTSDNIYS